MHHTAAEGTATAAPSSTCIEVNGTPRYVADCRLAARGQADDEAEEVDEEVEGVLQKAQNVYQTVLDMKKPKCVSWSAHDGCQIFYETISGVGHM